jgi:hypothetical protein
MTNGYVTNTVVGEPEGSTPPITKLAITQIMIQFHPSRILIAYIPKLHLNFILSSSGWFKWTISKTFLNQNSACIICLLPSNMIKSLHSHTFHSHVTTRWPVYITKFLSTCCPELLTYFILPRPKYIGYSSILPQVPKIIRNPLSLSSISFYLSTNTKSGILESSDYSNMHMRSTWMNCMRTYILHSEK